MEKVKTEKDILQERIQNEIEGTEIRKEYLQNYKKVIATPTLELIAEHIKTGNKNIDGCIELNTELLIRILLKG